MTVVQKLAGAGGLFILIIITGFIVSRLGKPYNTALFTVHKLLALALIAGMVFIVRGLLVNAGADALVIALLVLSALLFIGLFATGGLLSARDAGHKIMVVFHSILPVLAGISSAAAIYLLMMRE